MVFSRCLMLCVDLTRTLGPACLAQLWVLGAVICHYLLLAMFQHVRNWLALPSSED